MNKATNTSQQAAFQAGASKAPSPTGRAGAPNLMDSQMSPGPMPLSNTDLRGAKNYFPDKEGVPRIPNSRKA